MNKSTTANSDPARVKQALSFQLAFPGEMGTWGWAGLKYTVTNPVGSSLQAAAHKAYAQVCEFLEGEFILDAAKAVKDKAVKAKAVKAKAVKDKRRLNG